VPENGYRSGELARATGITVRTLHHYDRLGLLVPSSHTAGGHRCYTPDDVRRLHRILALRSFGLSLTEIAQTLDAAAEDARDLIRRQLAVAEERVHQAQQLRFRLLDVLAALEEMSQPSTTELIDLIEVMTTMNQPLTPEEVQQMSLQRKEFLDRLSADEVAELSRKRQEVMRNLDPEQLAEMHQRRAQLLPPGKAGNG
jgi:MerR family transcriptional regulator, thiopeptide resistance regulator